MEKFQPQKGLSLIEVLIAMTLSSLLLLGVMRMFMDSSRSSASDIALSQVQDSARIAMEMIKRDVRMAGFRGRCVIANAPTTNGSLVNLDNQSVIGVEGNKTSSDSLAVLSAEEMMRPDVYGDASSTLNPVYITNFNNAGKIEFNRNICFSSTDVFLVSDCRQLAAFSPKEAQHACKDDPAETKTTDKLTPIGAKKAEVSFKDYTVAPECSDETDLTTCPTLHNLGSTTGIVYDIRKTTRLGSDGKPLFALFRAGEEMVEGIENMQVLYGIRQGNKIAYTKGCTQASVSAGTCNPGNTTHIQVSLLVASSNNVSDTNKQQTFNILNLAENKQLTTNDRRLRRLFITTIQLRSQR